MLNSFHHYRIAHVKLSVYNYLFDNTGHKVTYDNMVTKCEVLSSR